MNRKLPLLALALVAASAYAADAQVYKWTDAAGVVHYSDAPPPKDTLNVQTVRVSGGDRPHAVNNENNETNGAADKPRDTASGNPAPADASMADTPDNRAKLCETARGNLELLQSKFPVTITGTSQPLDDKARQAQVAAANAAVELYCR
ncbi:MAG: DUF4124 domain-containing protein [Rudaea sp.]|nr:DUF4124 domain-containing protein [Rudaea sp.]